MNTYRHVTPLVLGAFLIACGDDVTGPGPLDLRLAASVFDALSRSRLNAGDGFGATASRHVALALRSGVRPARVTISVDGATDHYWALEVEHALGDDAAQGPLPAEPFIVRSMTAWRGSRPERVISVTIAGDTGTFSSFPDPLSELPLERPTIFELSVGTMFENRGGPMFFATDGGARSTRQSIGGSCPVPRPPSMSQLILPVAAPTACNRASFFTRFNMRVLEGPVPGAVAARARVVQMDGHEIAGIRLEYPPLPTLCPVCGG